MASRGPASSVTHISAYSAPTSGSLWQSTAEGSRIYKETFDDRIKQWRTWLYGRDYEDRVKVMGRTIIDWGEKIFQQIYLRSHTFIDLSDAFAYVMNGQCLFYFS